MFRNCSQFLDSLENPTGVVILYCGCTFILCLMLVLVSVSELVSPSVCLENNTFDLST